MNIVHSFSGVSTNDTESTKNFYTNVLGLKLKSDQMGLLFELPNESEIFIYEKDDHTPANYTVLNLVVDNIEQAVNELKEKGVVFEKYDWGGGAKTDELDIMRGKSAGMGPDIAWFKDPAGNFLAVLEN